MAKKFYIQSQSPVAELSVVSEKDAEGKSQKILVGFKRYPANEAQKKLESFKDLSDEQAKNLIINEVLYIKDVVLEVYDDETGKKLETIKIADTRTAQPIESFWADKDECLAVLLDNYLDSIPWKGSLITAYITSLYNMDVKNNLSKNS
jgi:hypothetical protein